jgi:virulence factor Mce-like protein
VSPRLRSIAIGGTSIVVAALLILVILPAVGILGGGGDTYRVRAYFSRAVSVFPSSDVRVLGLPAGTVKEVEVEGDRVRVEMDIKSDIPIPKDVRAQIVPQSLIGERYIQLSPAFKEGMEAAPDEFRIPDENTVIPVEPDEALAEIKKFLDSLDPDGLGRLVTNLDEDLEGNGQVLNDALASLGEVVSTFAEKDDALVRIVDSFDRLTTTLVTREAQLGEVLDAFATASQVLADERQGIEDLVGGLATLSREGLQLVGTHQGALREDIEVLAGVASSIDANLASVTQLLDAGGLLAEGLVGAYNPTLRAVNLRNNFSPLIPELIELLLGPLGVPSLCLPVLATCDDVIGLTEAGPTTARITPDPSPVGALLDLLGRPTAAPTVRDDRSVLERAGDAMGDAASTLFGVGR